MPGRVHVGATPLGEDHEPLLTSGILRREQWRIPNTSVVNLVCTLPGCGRLTAAILIWSLNLICFLVHLAFFIVTLVYLLGWDGKERQLWAPVYRIRANWTEPGVAGYAFDLVENQQGLNIGVITAVWFGITAGFHLLALIAGAFERFWMFYWRQMVRSPPQSLLRPRPTSRARPASAGRRILLVVRPLQP